MKNIDWVRMALRYTTYQEYSRRSPRAAHHVGIDARTACSGDDRLGDESACLTNKDGN